MSKRNFDTDQLELPSNWRSEPETMADMFILNLRVGDSFHLGCDVEYTVEDINKSRIKISKKWNGKSTKIIIRHCGPYGIVFQHKETGKEIICCGFYTGKVPFFRPRYKKMSDEERDFLSFLRTLPSFIATRIIAGIELFYGDDEKFVLEVIGRDFGLSACVEETQRPFTQLSLL